MIRRQHRLSHFLVAIGCTFAVLATHAKAAVTQDAPRYFAFVNFSGLPKINANEFILEVTDPVVAAQFQLMVSNALPHPKIAFTGTVVPGREPYNEAWAFHVDPSSVQIGGSGNFEECSLTPEYVEEHVHLVGKDILYPDGHWCSFDMHITREVLR
jgi:hypothetical protein